MGYGLQSQSTGGRTETFRHHYGAADNVGYSGVFDDSDDDGDDDDDDRHLDGFAECDLCSGDEEAGEGRGEERVWATWQI